MTPVEAWHALVAEPDPEALRRLLAPDAVFRSPAVHRPQEGLDEVHRYLWAAVTVLGPTLHYHRSWPGTDSAVLEFTATVSGLDVHGVDIITWDPAGRITDFTVMVRPVKGLQALIEAMGQALTA